jgi:signal peptidase I
MPEQKDAFRETVETVVFVVVLVLLLKAFMAEAFVIPTGSMATTLLGYHRTIECPECGFRFPLNTSRQVEDNQPITGCRCPNCNLHIDANNSRQFQP